MSPSDVPPKSSAVAPDDVIRLKRKSMPIAIIGMSCRFPGDATSPERLWEMCAGARDSWSTIPESRFNVNAFYDTERGKIGLVYPYSQPFVKILSRTVANHLNLKVIRYRRTFPSGGHLLV